jgi:hypothetical protein
MGSFKIPSTEILPSVNKAFSFFFFDASEGVLFCPKMIELKDKTNKNAKRNAMMFVF